MFLCRALPSWWCMMMLILGLIVVIVIWKINYGRIKFCWVNERRKYHLPWLGCGLPPTSSLFVQCNASLIVWITASVMFVLSVDHSNLSDPLSTLWTIGLSKHLLLMFRLVNIFLQLC
jgi:hypothetical protein